MHHNLDNMFKINGAYCEGGGQIVRTALGLSTLTGKAVEIKDIRKGRPKPGLKSQHLHCVKALEQLCNAKTEGAEIGSEFLRYFPGEYKAKNLDIDIGTAGSITLLLQSLLIPCAFGKPIKLSVIGGTDVKWSQPADYFREVLLPQLRRFADIEFRILKRGYFPKGQGKVEIKIRPTHAFMDAEPFELVKQTELQKIKIFSHASSDLPDVAERQSKAAYAELMKLGPVEIINETCKSASTGSGISCFAYFDNNVLGGDCLGERGKRAEHVGQEAARNLIKEINSKAPVDKYLGDNLIPYLLVGNRIKPSEITNHTKSNIYVVEQFFGNVFEIKEGQVIKPK